MKKQNDSLQILDFIFKIVGHFIVDLISAIIRIHQTMVNLKGEKMSNEDLGSFLSELAKECVKLIDERMSPDTVAKLAKMKIDPIEAILLHMKRVDRSDCVNLNQEF